MPLPGVVDSRGVVLAFFLFVFFLLRRQWRNAASKREDVFRLVALASHDTVADELQIVGDHASSLEFHRCSVCLCPTTTRCSRCKAVRYCSSKCQIMHWRHGHKEECQSPTPIEDCLHESDPKLKTGSENLLLSHGDETLSTETSSLPKASCLFNGYKNLESPFDAGKGPTELLENLVPSANVPLRSKELANRSREKDILSRCHVDKSAVYNHLQKQKFSDRNPSRSASSTGKPAIYDPSVTTTSLVAKPKVMLTENPVSTQNLPQNDLYGLKVSVKKVLKSFSASRMMPSTASVSQNGMVRNPKCKMILPYEFFVKLYSCDGVELFPFGLVNSGNSCYANAVLQCLTFTRPLTSYLVKRFHSKACKKNGWCFICEFEHLVMDAKNGKNPVSPAKVLSKIKKFGKHPSQGGEQDAHEFLRYVVDTMQSVFLKEIDATEQSAEETTLMGLTFGGSLHSKIQCLNCFNKSERLERMMDLTVEIDGNIESLEDALAQFTATELLDGKNQYRCGRCQSYQKAKKKLMVLDAPNVLTIVLKRFQSGSFGKLSKPIRFPEILNMAPFIGGAVDTTPYSLYAVVVHLDISNAVYSGHYVCYVKGLHGEWFKINDSMVTPVPLESVLLDEAYMLLYARDSPRAPYSVRKTMESRPLIQKMTSKAVPSRIDHDVDPSSSKRDRIQSLNADYNWETNKTDSSSEVSSIFSCSDVSSCSTTASMKEPPTDGVLDHILVHTERHELHQAV